MKTLILVDKEFGTPDVMIYTDESLEIINRALAEAKEKYDDWTLIDLLDNLPEGTTWEFINLEDVIKY